MYTAMAQAFTLPVAVVVIKRTWCVLRDDGSNKTKCYTFKKGQAAWLLLPLNGHNSTHVIGECVKFSESVLNQYIEHVTAAQLRSASDLFQAGSYTTCSDYVARAAAVTISGY